MIITRSPLRITLGGGGTDLASYYTQREGFLIAAAIDKYVYVTVTRPFSPGIYLKYSTLEHVDSVGEIKHPIIREALTIQDMPSAQIEITTLADIPAGTGLGSSGSFTTALLKALFAYQHKVAQSQELAELACHIEIERLREPIGKQDQFMAAFGGLTCLTFHKDHQVTVQPLRIAPRTMYDLEDNLLLFFTGFNRSAGSILKHQHERSLQGDQEILRNLDHVKTLGYRSQEALESGDVEGFGALMHEQWEYKKRRSGHASNPKIDQWYSLAMDNGALGGKLVGAGGGGFLMFYAGDRARLRRVLNQAGLEEVRFRFDFEGSKVVLS
jgi:D-glycero-alpha-D-manno-heptose-7-phosphate kinase